MHAAMQCLKHTRSPQSYRAKQSPALNVSHIRVIDYYERSRSNPPRVDHMSSTQGLQKFEIFAARNTRIKIYTEFVTQQGK